MTKDACIFGSVMLFVFVVIFIPIIYLGNREQQWLTEHNCKLLHQNPEYTVLQWNGVVMVPMVHEGKKFYECNDGEWK